MDLLESLVSWFSRGWVGSLLGIAGLVAAFLTYRWTRQRSILAYKKGGLRLLGGSNSQLPTEVEVLYRGESITFLSRSVVVLWNAGEKSISGADLATIDRLRIEVSQDCKILSVQSVGVTRPVIQFSCTPSNPPRQAILSFEFLDRHDGAVIEVLHTDKPGSLNVVGAVRGIPSGLSYLGSLNTPLHRAERKVAYLAFGLVAASLACVAVGIFAPIEALAWPFQITESVPEAQRLIALIRAPLFLLAALLILPAGVLIFLLLQPRYPESLATIDYWTSKSLQSPQ